MSLEAELREIIEQMKVRSKVEFEAGLSDAEINHIETRCDFRFPPDLKMFLQLGVPVKCHKPSHVEADERFPNWHKDPLEIMQWSREWAIGTFTFDIENNDFWMSEWGEKPEGLDEQLAVATEYLKDVPALIPIYAHRFIPAEPCEAGNPVFSIWQAVDSIYYGRNLQDYLRHEFISEEYDYSSPSDYRHIPFWSAIMLGEQAPTLDDKPATPRRLGKWFNRLGTKLE